MLQEKYDESIDSYCDYLKFKERKLDQAKPRYYFRMIERIVNVKRLTTQTIDSVTVNYGTGFSDTFWSSSADTMNTNQSSAKFDQMSYLNMRQ